MLLSEIIIQRIHRNGPISFHDFMEMALYYPGLGYYSSAREKIGMQGDYYTSPLTSPIFGELIGRQLEEMWCFLGKKEFTLVEYGAGTGVLCQQILQYLQTNKALHNQFHYCIIEKSKALRGRQQKLLGGRVKWFDSIQEVPDLVGCVLSNEVLDNFSVHQVVMENELMEVFVDDNNGFVEVLKPAPEALRDYLHRQNVVLPKGFRTEINLQAREWIRDIARALKKGFVLTIDYGYSSAELYRDLRRCGTLVCYHKHSVNTDPFSHVGEQDITAHVNFSDLNRWGLKNGLACGGFTDQAHFLHALGLVSHLRKIEEREKNSLGESMVKSWQVYKLLMDMGAKFKVLVQQKGIRQRLSGMAFSQELV